MTESTNQVPGQPVRQAQHSLLPLWRGLRTGLRRRDRVTVDAGRPQQPSTAAERAEWNAILGRYDDSVTADLRDSLELAR